MRYDRKIWLVDESAPEYDETTGDYTDGAIERYYRDANVSDTGTETMNMLYGKIKQGALTVRVQNQIEMPYRYIEVDTIGNKYLIDRVKHHRNEVVLFVSESQ